MCLLYLLAEMGWVYRNEHVSFIFACWDGVSIKKWKRVFYICLLRWGEYIEMNTCLLYLLAEMGWVYRNEHVSFIFACWDGVSIKKWKRVFYICLLRWGEYIEMNTCLLYLLAEMGWVYRNEHVSFIFACWDGVSIKKWTRVFYICLLRWGEYIEMNTCLLYLLAEMGWV